MSDFSPAKGQILVDGVRSIYETLAPRLAFRPEKTTFLSGESSEGMEMAEYIRNSMADVVAQTQHILELAMDPNELEGKPSQFKFPARAADVSILKSTEELSNDVDNRQAKPAANDSVALNLESEVKNPGSADLQALLEATAADKGFVAPVPHEKSMEREFMREILRVHETALYLMRSTTPSSAEDSRWGAEAWIQKPLAKIVEEGARHGVLEEKLGWSKEAAPQHRAIDFDGLVPHLLEMVQKEWMIRLQGVHQEVLPPTTFHYGSGDKKHAAEMSHEDYYYASAREVAQNGRQFINVVGIEFGLGANDCGVLMRKPGESFSQTHKEQREVLKKISNPEQRRMLGDLMEMVDAASNARYREPDITILAPEKNLISLAIEQARVSAVIVFTPEAEREVIGHKRSGVVVPGVATIDVRDGGEDLRRQL